MKYDFIPDSVSEHDNVYDVLKERGFIEQSTDEEKVRELLQNEKVKFYIGFDPTADCLHVGHFMQVIIMMYMQKMCIRDRSSHDCDISMKLRVVAIPMFTAF